MKYIILIVLLILALNQNIECKSLNYYTILNDFTQDIDYYQILEVTRESTSIQIKKSFRQLSLKYHPDRTTDRKKHEIYIQLARAQEILLDEESRNEYNDILDNGIPFSERYYGRHMYRYTGVVNHDIRIILSVLVALITIVKHFYQESKFHRMMNRAKQTDRYRIEVKKLRSQGVNDRDPEIIVDGAEKPELRDLFILQLIRVPYVVVYYIYELIFIRKFRIFKSPEELDEDLRIKYKMSPEEWEQYKKEQQEKFEKFKSSAKYRRYVRYMKNK